MFDTRFVELPTLGKSSQFEKHFLFICIYFRFVHLWSQEKCPSCITGYNSPLLSPWVFEHEVLQCAILKHATRWVLSPGWFDPHYPHGSQDFSLQLENSGVMKTLWDHMGSVVKTNSFLIPTVFSYSISMFVVSGASWIGSMVVVKLTLASELWY